MSRAREQGAERVIIHRVAPDFTVEHDEATVEACARCKPFRVFQERETARVACDACGVECNPVASPADARLWVMRHLTENLDARHVDATFSVTVSFHLRRVPNEESKAEGAD